MNSLDILGLSSKPSASQEKSPSAIHIEDLCARAANVISTRNWDDQILLDHFAPDFEAFVEHSDTPVVRGAKDWMKVYAKLAADNPDYRNEVVSMISDVDEKAGTATVWMLMRIFGHPKDMVRESVTIIHAVRRNGKWLVLKQRGIRGIQMAD